MGKIIQPKRLNIELYLIREVNMLRTKHDNISIKFVALLTFCLCCGLTMYLYLAPAYAVPPPRQNFYVVDAYPTPGKVYRIQDRKPGIFFIRDSGNISSIALCEGHLFFCSNNNSRIYQKMERQERVVFEHNTYIRDIAVDSAGNMYFSVANDARGNGTIYRLTPPVNNLGSQRFSLQSTEPFYTINLNNVDGFWAGNFIFDVRDNLYLSSGHTPTFIYKVQKEGNNQYGSPQKIYEDTKGSIKGIAIDPDAPNFAYYTDWKQTIYKLDITNSKRSVEFSGNIAVSRSPRLSDIAFDVRIRR
jgi:hypothetical protein